jgi:hypothetical protein
MTTDQWHPAKRELDSHLTRGRIRELGLRLILLDGCHVIELFSRTRDGFLSIHKWSFPHGLMSESHLQDMITAFTKEFLEDVQTTPGVGLVLDS